MAVHSRKTAVDNSKTTVVNNREDNRIRASCCNLKKFQGKTREANNKLYCVQPHRTKPNLLKTSTSVFVQDQGAQLSCSLSVVRQLTV